MIHFREQFTYGGGDGYDGTMALIVITRMVDGRWWMVDGAGSKCYQENVYENTVNQELKDHGAHCIVSGQLGLPVLPAQIYCVVGFHPFVIRI